MGPESETACDTERAAERKEVDLQIEVLSAAGGGYAATVCVVETREVVTVAWGGPDTGTTGTSMVSITPNTRITLDQVLTTLVEGFGAMRPVMGS
jgi:hypothetical protein